ncbi:hypothetical protein CRENBAI_007106 [Crenichthys baileyi]|uniref:Uncharacterized protein n=1 Tax=Crenichthys baileyi TaxID=28760 RepID=A0AAV9RSQ0_9TELE
MEEALKHLPDDPEVLPSPQLLKEMDHEAPQSMDAKRAVPYSVTAPAFSARSPCCSKVFQVFEEEPPLALEFRDDVSKDKLPLTRALRFKDESSCVSEIRTPKLCPETKTPKLIDCIVNLQSSCLYFAADHKPLSSGRGSVMKCCHAKPLCHAKPVMPVCHACPCLMPVTTSM